jgi:hypothetical protein
MFIWLGSAIFFTRACFNDFVLGGNLRYYSSVQGIPNSVERFIFDYVDTINFLEALLALHATPQTEWTARSLAGELRSNENSIAGCMREMFKNNMLVEGSTAGSFKFQPADVAQAEVIDLLAQAYKVHRHKIYELIFSPLKKARDFADAFTRTGAKDKKEDGDG